MNKITPETSKVHKISVGQNNPTKQAEEGDKLYYIEPPISISSLVVAYENSFMIGGIMERIGTSANVGFKETGNKDLDELLGKIDMEELMKSFLVTGNFFFEKAFSLGKRLSLFPFLTQEVNLKKDGVLEQKSGSETVVFQPEEYIQLKRGSLSSRRWGESLIGRCVQQIILIQNIDKFYTKLFDRGLLSTFLLADKNNTMTQTEKDAVTAIIDDVFRGTNNSFSSGIVGGELVKIDLSSNVDNKYFIDLRTQAKKDIAIATTFPYDLLDAENSNRSISESSLEQLNIYIIQPNLKKVCSQLKEALRPYFGTYVDKIEHNAIDISNQKEEMEVDTGYVREGVKTPNEVREKLGLPSHEDGNTLRNRTPTPQDTMNQFDQVKQQIQASVKKMYIKK